MTETPVDRLKYYSQLDGLRCFAVLSVMFGHWIAWDARTSLLRNMPWGHGVILFFVLSGYLISNILFDLKEKMETRETSLKQALGTFYIRRFLRIFPAYYFLIFFLYAINHANTRAIFPWLVTFSSNILECRDGKFLGDFNHFWSLAVEEQFYIFWPFLLLLVPQKHVLKTIASLLVFSLLSRFFCYFYFTNWMVTSYFTTNLLFPLCLGALLAYARRYHMGLSNFFDSSRWLWFWILFYALFYYLHKFALSYNPYRAGIMRAVLDECVFSMAAAFVVFRASQNKFTSLANSVLTYRWVVFTGKISYGLYLYHLFVNSLFWRFLDPHFHLNIAGKYFVWFLYYVTGFTLAILSYYIIEQPFNRLKTGFKY